MRKILLFALATSLLLFMGCTVPKIRLFPSQADPLKEFTLEGKADQKVLVIPVRGIVTNHPKEGFIRTRPSMVQEVVSQLRLAEKDKNVKAVILKIDSPGGSVTASDVLFNEILTFKERTGATVVAAMMGVAASGGVLHFPAGRLYPGTSHHNYRLHRCYFYAPQSDRSHAQNRHWHGCE